MSGPLVPNDVATVWDAEVNRNDKPGVLERLYASSKKTPGLAASYCVRCDKTVAVISIEYPYDHIEHYDGVSEWRCSRCNRREGRWTGKVLTGGASEPRLGIERDEIIAEEQRRHAAGSQPR